jgi:hypothetical protein
MTVSVNNLRILIGGYPDIGKIVEVDMAVDKVFGFKEPHKGKKNLKPPVAPVFLVVNPPGRRVGQKNIQKAAPENAVKQEGREQFYYFQGHFKIGVLVFAPVIPHGASQARDDKAPLAPDSGTDVDRPGSLAVFRRFIPGINGRKTAVPLKKTKVLHMVIAEHKKQRFVEAADNKIEVVQGEIPGGENEVHIAETILNRIGIHEGINLVGDAEYFHRRREDLS